MTMELVGLPLDDWEKFADPFHAYPSSRPGTPELQRAIEGIERVHQQLGELVDARRRKPRDDLASSIIAAERPDKTRYSREEAVELLVEVVAGGVDTTTALTANAFWHLHACPGDRQRLIADPSLLKSATEEFLRFYTPIQGQARTAMRDCVMGGQAIAAGERVLLSLASANRDETQFEDADRFMIDRDHNLHAGFGLGMHRCVGSHFARLLFETMLFAVLDRIPDYAVVEERAERYHSIAAINGWAMMPVTFTPGVARGPGGTLPG
jgi:cytochrome P450